MNKIDHYIGLNKTGRHFIDILHEKLKESFANDKNMLKAIELSKKDESFNYEKNSEQPDEERAIRIAQHESQLEMLYKEDVTELIVRVCKLTHANAKDIVETHFSQEEET